MKINVKSEIGRLKKVFVHRPGKEVERLYPEILERMLFDDIMDLPIAQQEHDAFVAMLKAEGVDVFYIERLVAEALDAHPLARKELISDFLVQANITIPFLKDKLTEFFLQHKDNLDLVEALIAGVKKSELNIDVSSRLELLELAMDPYPFYLDPIPNILFQRDPIINIYNDFKINRMKKDTRRRERIFYDYLLKYHADWKENKSIVDHELPGSMEGGDVLVFNESTLFIGMSERTNGQAISTLGEKLFAKYKKLERIIAIEIPKSHATMHLDTILTQMDYDKFSIDADMYNVDYNAIEFSIKNNKTKISKFTGRIQNLIKKYVHPKPKFFVVGGGEIVRAKREQWNDGANCLCIRPGVIVVYSRNYHTNKLIRDGGIQTIEIMGSELSRGRGGPRCMTMPIEREDI